MNNLSEARAAHLGDRSALDKPRPQRRCHNPIDRFRRAGAGGDERQGLTPQRMLQPVTDKSRHVALDAHGDLAERPQELHGTLHDLLRSPTPANHFDDRYELRGIPPVRAHGALRTPRQHRDLRDGQHGRVAHEDGVGIDRSQAGKHLALEEQILADRLDHDSCVPNCLLEPCLRTHTVRGAGYGVSHRCASLRKRNRVCIVQNQWETRAQNNLCDASPE